MRGKESLPELADDWRFGGRLLDDVAETGQRREAFTTMLTLPRRTDPLAAPKAAREFAQVEVADHTHVMLLHDHQASPLVHDHQASPQVHTGVRSESMRGKRLNPRQPNLHCWRETFAEKLRSHGVEAEATRGCTRNVDPQWRVKAKEDGRLRSSRPTAKRSAATVATRAAAVDAWREIALPLAASGDLSDRDLVHAVATYVNEMPAVRSTDRSGVSPIPFEPTRHVELACQK